MIFPCVMWLIFGLIFAAWTDVAGLAPGARILGPRDLTDVVIYVILWPFFGVAMAVVSRFQRGVETA